MKRAYLSLGLGFLMIACAAADDAAPGAALAAVAEVVVYRDPTKVVCAGTLIAPDLVLTAKHCVMREVDTPWSAVGGSIELHFGPDAANPSYTARVNEVYACRLEEGGDYGVGCDMAVLRLTQRVPGIAPIPVSNASLAALVGSDFTTVSYGPPSRLRKQGTARLVAVEGKSLHALYATFDDLLAALEQVEGPEQVALGRAAYRTHYDQDLLASYEVRAGGADGNATIGAGDAGAPLLRLEGGRLTVSGLVSSPSLSRNGWGGSGAVYATFGPLARVMLDNAEHDPCVGLDSRGKCEGDVAIQCSKRQDGERRLIRTDCALVGQHCKIKFGPLACGDRPETTCARTHEATLLAPSMS